MAAVACVGIAVMDFLFAVKSLPSGDGKFYAESFQEIAGGVAANAACAVARLGGDSRYIGRVGDDRIGAVILDELGAEGVDTSGVQMVTGVPSPVSTVLVDESGERLIVNYTSPDLFAAGDSPATQQLDGVDAVLVDVRWPTGAAAALQASRQRAIPSIFDFDRPMDDDGQSLLGSCTHVVFSAAALEVTSGIASPPAALVEIAGRTDAWLAVTLGGAGVMWLHDGVAQHLPAFDVAVVDTVGAGDVFHGALALAIAEGMDEADAVRFAAAAAAIKCSRPGARAGTPVRHEVDDFLKELG